MSELKQLLPTIFVIKKEYFSIEVDRKIKALKLLVEWAESELLKYN